MRVSNEYSTESVGKEGRVKTSRLTAGREPECGALYLRAWRVYKRAFVAFWCELIMHVTLCLAENKQPPTPGY